MDYMLYFSLLVLAVIVGRIIHDMIKLLIKNMANNNVTCKICNIKKENAIKTNGGFVIINNKHNLCFNCFKKLNNEKIKEIING